MTESRPRATLAVIAYNQEAVIRDAIEGAFAQTYSPLEIILSDDCSPDSTFEIMQQMAVAYDGPHRVIARQTRQNLRLVPHIDDVTSLASGDFFVANAGDDISLSDRVESLMEVWEAGAGRITLVHSAAEEMTAVGVPTGVIKRPPERVRNSPTGATFIRDRGFVIGATAGWDRRVFDHFGPLGAGLSAEDRVVPFRASLLGEIAYLDRPLVRHRMDGVSGETGAPPGYEYLYGISHKLRKWTTEIDRYVLKHYEPMDYPGKATIEAACRARAPRLQFMVDLAEAGYSRRLALLPRALGRMWCDRSVRPLKHWLRYLLDKPYLAYANRRQDGDARRKAPDLLGKE